MDQSQGWGRSRYATLVLVLAAHVALVAAMLVTSRSMMRAAIPDPPLEVLLLPSPPQSRVRVENFRPRRLNTDTALVVALPMLEAVAYPAALGGPSSDGSGRGVDWKAEARRAVQAYDIRSRQPVENTMSVSPAEENWWPWGQHRAGDRFKTQNGDWIVWIDANCYKIATSAAGGYAPGMILSPTICSGGPGK